MTALVLVLVLYGVLAAVLVLVAYAAPAVVGLGLAERESGLSCRIERLWWSDVEPPIPIRRRPAYSVLLLRTT